MLYNGHVTQWPEYVATNYGVGGSNPSLLIYIEMGCRQAVRQWTLTPLFVGSIPTLPDAKAYRILIL